MRIRNITRMISVRGTERVFMGKEGMSLLLRRLATLVNVHHLSPTFDQSSSASSELLNAILDHVYPYAKRALRLEVRAHELPHLLEELVAKGCRIPACFGFFKGTPFKFC